jgi:small subunit ribosomal protein S3Ae
MAKTLTSWKSKKLYTILAPENFDNKELGETLASDPKKLIGRTVDISLSELIEDRGKYHLKLVFRVADVKSDKAYTKFKRFFIPTGYLRSKVRKGMSKLDYISDLDFKGEGGRVKIMILTRHKISAEQKTTLRKIVDRVLQSHKSRKLDHLVQLTLFGKLGTEIYKKCKLVLPITRVEVYEIISLG